MEDLHWSSAVRFGQAIWVIRGMLSHDCSDSARCHAVFVDCARPSLPCGAVDGLLPWLVAANLIEACCYSGCCRWHCLEIDVQLCLIEMASLESLLTTDRLYHTCIGPPHSTYAHLHMCRGRGYRISKRERKSIYRFKVASILSVVYVVID